MPRVFWAAVVVVIITAVGCLAVDEGNAREAEYAGIQEEQGFNGAGMQYKDDDTLEKALQEAAEEAKESDFAEGEYHTVDTINELPGGGEDIYQNTFKQGEGSQEDYLGTSQDGAFDQEEEVESDPSKEPEQTSQNLMDPVHTQDPEVYEVAEDGDESEAVSTEHEAEEEGDEGEQTTQAILDEEGDLKYVESDVNNEEFLESYDEDDNSTFTFNGYRDQPSSQVMREPLVGVGYHLIYGNPDGSFVHGGRDPGLKRTRRIMRPSMLC